MRRRRHRRWLLPLTVGALWLGREVGAQTAPLPPALDDRASLPPIARDQRSGLSAVESMMPVPAAPRPIPGPASAGLPRGGKDAAVPRGLPINFATAMALAGIRPLDIAAATAQVQQALALHLQAKALWIPNLNAGLDYFRHDGVQQNIFTGENFRKGRQSFFVGGGPFLNVGLTDAIFAPLAARRVVAAHGPISRPHGTTSCSRSRRRSSTSRRRAGGCWAWAPRSTGPSCW